MGILNKHLVIPSKSIYFILQELQDDNQLSKHLVQDQDNDCKFTHKTDLFVKISNLHFKCFVQKLKVQPMVDYLLTMLSSYLMCRSNLFNQNIISKSRFHNNVLVFKNQD